MFTVLNSSLDEVLLGALFLNNNNIIIDNKDAKLKIND